MCNANRGLFSGLSSKKKRYSGRVLHFKIIQAHSKDENCAPSCAISQTALEDLAKPVVFRNPSHTHTHPLDSLRQISPCSFALALQSPAANSCKISEHTADHTVLPCINNKMKKKFKNLLYNTKWYEEFDLSSRYNIEYQKPCNMFLAAETQNPTYRLSLIITNKPL